MNSYFSIDLSSEVIHGDFFSVFCDDHDSYWVVNNEFHLVFEGPFDLKTAMEIMSTTNEYVNYFKSKGLDL